MTQRCYRLLEVEGSELELEIIMDTIIEIALKFREGYYREGHRGVCAAVAQTLRLTYRYEVKVQMDCRSRSIELKIIVRAYRLHYT